MAQPIKEIPAGTKFGRLTVRHRQEKPGNNKAHFLCGCECGGEILVRGSTLRLGRTSSCGCLRVENCIKVARNRKELRLPAGTRGEMLEIIRYDHRGPGGAGVYLCKCDCGRECMKNSHQIRYNRSCGCARTGVAGLLNPSTRTTHGQSHTPEYHAWRGMRDRCTRSTCAGYEHYGGRGIKVCDRWLGSFENFFADMGARPNPKDSLDRIDVNGNYEPGNCRWADIGTQNRNRRPRLRIEEYSDEAILAEMKRRGLTES